MQLILFYKVRSVILIPITNILLYSLKYWFNWTYNFYSLILQQSYNLTILQSSHYAQDVFWIHYLYFCVPRIQKIILDILQTLLQCVYHQSVLIQMRFTKNVFNWQNRLFVCKYMKLTVCTVWFWFVLYNIN